MKSYRRAAILLPLFSIALLFQNCSSKSADSSSASSSGATPAGATSPTTLTASPTCWNAFGTTLLNSCDGTVLMGAGMVGVGTAAPIASMDVMGTVAVSNETGGYRFKDNNGKLDARVWEGVGNNLNILAGSGGTIKFLNSNPNAAGLFDINGNWFTSGQFQNSDARLKQDIKPLKNVLARLDDIEGVTYEWKDEGRRKSDGSQIGVVAQKVQKSFPQLVKSGENLDPKSELKTVLSVDYSHLTAVLLAGLKELALDWRSDSKKLHEENERLMKRVEELEKRLGDPKVASAQKLI